jgi:signal transduction histidine kinase
MLTATRWGRTVLALLSVGFAALVFSGGAAIWWAQQARVAAEWVNHSAQVKQISTGLLLSLRRAESAQRGYLLTASKRYLEGYGGARSDALGKLTDLRGLVMDKPDQAARVDAIALLSRRKIAEMDETVRVALQGRREAGIAAVKSNVGLELMDAIRSGVEAFEQGENLFLEDRRAAQEQATRWVLLVSLTTGVLVTAVGLGSIAIIARYIREVRMAGQLVEDSNRLLEERVRSRTQEIADVNAEIQRFAYIVSHDLRAPLVNIMGFTSELDRAGAVLARQLQSLKAAGQAVFDAEATEAVEQDIPEAIRFIRQSSGKMDRLINAVLGVSREGRRTLNSQPLDMTTLVKGVASSLHKAAQAKGAQITVGLLPNLTSDRLAVEMIFGNLMENAVKYLDPERPGQIEVAGAVAGETRIYTIRDNGRGIAPADHERVFELFRRAGTQDTPGEGLGLAFVRTAVGRIGGSITLESVAQAGSVFTVRLPARLNLEPDSVE